MTSDQRNDEHTADRFETELDRRAFIAAGAAGATMLAGCASEDSSGDAPDDGSSDSSGDETTEGEEESTIGDGNFRLLVSDMPVAIGDFERLDVSLDSARIFDGGASDEGDDEEKDDEENGDEEAGDDAETDDEQATQTTALDPDKAEGDEEEADDGEASGEKEDDEKRDDDEKSASEDGEDGGDESDGKVERRRGFYWADLEDATVDLTQVVGDKAVSVFEGELSPGTYEKIELHVSGTEGVVDGEVVDVKVPSEKLQIPHSFEVPENEPLEFVFDINVVEKGNGGYNLTPVISESGVVGEDVEVDRVDEESDDEGDGDDGSDGAADEADRGGDGDDADGGGTGEADDDGDDESGSNP